MCSLSVSTRSREILLPRWKTENCTLCTTQHRNTIQHTQMFLWGEGKNSKAGRGGARPRGLRRVRWGNSRVSGLSARSEPSIVGLIQAGDGCVLNPLFPIQMFLVVWLKGKEGGGWGGCTTHLVSFHLASPPFLNSDTWRQAWYSPFNPLLCSLQCNGVTVPPWWVQARHKAKNIQMCAHVMWPRS